MIPRISFMNLEDAIEVSVALELYEPYARDADRPRIREMMAATDIELRRLTHDPSSAAVLVDMLRDLDENVPDLSTVVNERDPYPTNRLDGLTVHHVGTTKVHHATGVRCKLCPKVES